MSGPGVSYPCDPWHPSDVDADEPFSTRERTPSPFPTHWAPCSIDDAKLSHASPDLDDGWRQPAARSPSPHMRRPRSEGRLSSCSTAVAELYTFLDSGPNRRRSQPGRAAGGSALGDAPDEGGSSEHSFVAMGQISAKEICGALFESETPTQTAAPEHARAAAPFGNSVVLEEVLVGEDGYVDGDLVSLDANRLRFEGDGRAFCVHVSRPCTLLLPSDGSHIFVADAGAMRNVRCIARLDFSKGGDGDEILGDEEHGGGSSLTDRRSCLSVLEAGAAHSLATKTMTSVEDNPRARRLSRAVHGTGAME